MTNREKSPEWVEKLEQAKDAKQLFIVAGVGLTTAYVSMHEKDSDGVWRIIMSTPGFIGKNGLGTEKEGDKKTPVGVFKFTKAFGTADDPGCGIGYVKLTDDLYWSGDHYDGKTYNKMVSIKDYPSLDTSNSEHLIEYKTCYEYCIDMGYNKDCTVGKGSAIFLHCFGEKCPYTAGCTAIPREKMKTVLQNVTKDCVIVIDKAENLGAAL